MEDYVKQNQRTINKWVKGGWEWGRPITHDTYQKVLHGEFAMFLTPTKAVPSSWLSELKGKKVLGLAAGGGQQGPILTALGAEVTIIDFSQEQLAAEHVVSKREGYHITTVCGNIAERLPFKDGYFDMVVHPVANVYIKNVYPLWREVARILRPKGLLLAGLDNGINYIVDQSEKRIINHLPFDPLSDPAQMKQLEEEDCGVQFSHTVEEQIGGQLKAGFNLLDIYGDTNGEGYLDQLNIPSFWATRSQKV